MEFKKVLNYSAIFVSVLYLIAGTISVLMSLEDIVGAVVTIIYGLVGALLGARALEEDTHIIDESGCALVLLWWLLSPVLLPALAVAFVPWVLGSGVQRLRSRRAAAEEARREHGRRIASLKQKLEQWEPEGYAVSELKRVMVMKNIDQMEQQFGEAEQKIASLKRAEEHLTKLLEAHSQEQTVFEPAIASIRKKLKDLSKADEVKREVQDLGKRLSEYGSAKDEIVGMIGDALRGKGGDRR